MESNPIALDVDFPGYGALEKPREVQHQRTGGIWKLLCISAIAAVGTWIAMDSAAGPAVLTSGNLNSVDNVNAETLPTCVALSTSDPTFDTTWCMDSCQEEGAGHEATSQFGESGFDDRCLSHCEGCDANEEGTETLEYETETLEYEYNVKPGTEMEENDDVPAPASASAAVEEVLAVTEMTETETAPAPAPVSAPVPAPAPGPVPAPASASAAVEEVLAVTETETAPAPAPAPAIETAPELDYSLQAPPSPDVPAPAPAPAPEMEMEDNEGVTEVETAEVSEEPVVLEDWISDTAAQVAYMSEQLADLSQSNEDFRVDVLDKIKTMESGFDEQLDGLEDTILQNQ